jgi:hypothetical protein
MIYILPATVKRLDMPVSPSGSLGYIIIDIESIKLIQKEVDYDKYSDF